jgi:hypothetical protein
MAKAGDGKPQEGHPMARYPKVPADHPMYGGGYVFGFKRASSVAPSAPKSDRPDLTVYPDGTITAGTPAGQTFLDENVGDDEYPNIGGGGVSVDQHEAEQLAEYAARIGLTIHRPRHAPYRFRGEPKREQFKDQETFEKVLASWRRMVKT